MKIQDKNNIESIISLKIKRAHIPIKNHLFINFYANSNLKYNSFAFSFIFRMILK